ncbi:unnamed protein product [Linum tenue]|uniref:KIB1-4 beta-propeller domain-containing protein n=1 Tax=Linum tenue TaxID=586396 RepID=A0AAV0HTR0_9ROSI|nr:unnamed protein product [Linum tenue]
MDADRRRWVRAANLSGAAGDEEKRALFLGGGDSVSVPAGGGIAADSLYYTDDGWERMDEDYLYGGHDIGVFDLREGKIRRIDDEFEEDKFDPAAELSLVCFSFFVLASLFSLFSPIG